MKYILPLFTLFVITNSCNKKGSGTVEIYLLKTVQLVQFKCQVDAANSTIEETPLVRNQDIVKYFKNDYEFELTNKAIEKIKALNDKTPFAITVDKKVMYYGFFKPSFSSSSCDHSITMDVNWSSEDKIRMKLGYPGQLQGVTIDDKRNDQTLLTALADQRKLK